MEKTCILCGRSIHSESSRCVFCGASQDVAFTPQEAPVAVSKKAPAVKKLWPRLIWFSAGAASAAVLALVIFLITLIPTGPERAVANYVKVYNGDLSQIEKLLPEETWDEYSLKLLLYGESGISSRAKVLARASQQVQEARESTEKTYGAFTIHYTVLKQTPVSEATMQDIQNYLQEHLRIDPSQVTQAVKLNVWFGLEGTTQSSDELPSRLCAVKIGGEWYLMNLWEGESGFSLYFHFELH